MILSRFWSFIIAGSIIYLLVMLSTGRLYTIGQVVNGKQNDPVLVAEMPVKDFQTGDTAFYSALLQSGSTGIQQGDTLYLLNESGTVQVTSGKQPADGIFMTCKNTLLDIWLPLIGYLTFFCGLLNLLSASNALDKLARFMTPLFVKIFPELPKGHPAYGFMTMNFAANFLGLDNAATPFGLKAMESMQEENKNKEVAPIVRSCFFVCMQPGSHLFLLPLSGIAQRNMQQILQTSCCHVSSHHLSEPLQH